MIVYSKAANSSFLSGKNEENVLVVSSELKRRGKRKKKKKVIFLPAHFSDLIYHTAALRVVSAQGR